MKNRSNIKSYFDKVLDWIERHLGKETGRMHTDVAPEFAQMRRDLGRIGIITIKTLSTYTPQYNGLAERKNRVLTEKARMML